MRLSGKTPEDFNAFQQGSLPGLPGLEVSAVDAGKTIALFRCTQMVLWPK